MSDKKTGYKNPPKHSQFKKGESGNKKGRPKNKRMNTFDYFERILRKKVTVKENGSTRTMETWEAILELQVAKALKGDSKSEDRFFKMLPLIEQRIAAEEQKKSLMTDEDKKCAVNAINQRAIAMMRKYGYQIPEELAKLEEK